MNTTTRPLDDLSSEEVRVRDWRMEQFQRLGFSDVEASILAETPEVEVSRVRSLLHAGCPRPMILQIVL